LKSILPGVRCDLPLSLSGQKPPLIRAGFLCTLSLVFSVSSLLFSRSILRWRIGENVDLERVSEAVWPIFELIPFVAFALGVFGLCIGTRKSWSASSLVCSVLAISFVTGSHFYSILGSVHVVPEFRCSNFQLIVLKCAGIHRGRVEGRVAFDQSAAKLRRYLEKHPARCFDQNAPVAALDPNSTPYLFVDGSLPAGRRIVGILCEKHGVLTGIDGTYLVIPRHRSFLKELLVPSLRAESSLRRPRFASPLTVRSPWSGCAGRGMVPSHGPAQAFRSSNQ
jgi:hypothetical protein